MTSRCYSTRMYCSKTWRRKTQRRAKVITFNSNKTIGTGHHHPDRFNPSYKINIQSHTLHSAGLCCVWRRGFMENTQVSPEAKETKPRTLKKNRNEDEKNNNNNNNEANKKQTLQLRLLRTVQWWSYKQPSLMRDRTRPCRHPLHPIIFLFVPPPPVPPGC